MSYCLGLELKRFHFYLFLRIKCQFISFLSRCVCHSDVGVHMSAHVCAYCCEIHVCVCVCMCVYVCVCVCACVCVSSYQSVPQLLA